MAQCSQLHAVEGILYSRGEEMENSTYFDKEKLAVWLDKIIPTLPKF